MEYKIDLWNQSITEYIRHYTKHRTWMVVSRADYTKTTSKPRRIFIKLIGQKHANFRCNAMDNEMAPAKAKELLREIARSDIPNGQQSSEWCAFSIWRHIIIEKKLYGLRQSGSEWNTEVNCWFIEYRFVQCETEPCLYFYDHDEIITIPLSRWMTSYAQQKI